MKSIECLTVDPKKKYGDDVLLPKKPLSAYFYFTTTNCASIREKEGCTHMESMAKASQIWATMTDKEKKKYTALHDADEKRHQE